MIVFRIRDIVIIAIVSIILMTILIASGAFRGENPDYVSFSVASGFYDDEFELELSAPIGWDIYYTVDSSEPSDESIKYDGAIHFRSVRSGICFNHVL